jgi:formamidopyrimidine-DNA glycosylase
MPELPEVETLIRDLRKRKLIGKKVVGAKVFWDRIISQPHLEDFLERVQGQEILDLSRRGKYLIFTLSCGDSLIIHLRMTGKLNFAPSSSPAAAHEHVILSLDDGNDLRYHDTRKFGRWSLVRDPLEVVGHLGPEPLADDFSKKSFENLIQGRNRQMKALLLDQTFLAGLGNIYVDEALWESQIHPETPANTLSQKEIHLLYHAIRNVLKHGIENMGTTLGSSTTNYYSVNGRRGRNADRLNVFRRHDTPCPRCKTTIIRFTVAQRGTHICPHCQLIH